MKLYFKFKIALLSFAVSGILLVLFGIALFAFIYSSGIERIDRELRSLAEIPLRGGPRADSWNSFGQSLASIYADRTEQIVLAAVGGDGSTLFKSENFPRELNARIPPPPSTDPNAFITRLDRDRDGRVSRGEFDGPPDRFAVHDLNRDNFIDSDEIAHVPAPQFTGGPAQPPHHNGQLPPGRSPFSAASPIEAAYSTVRIGSAPWRAAVFSTPETAVLMAMNMDAFHREIRRFRTAFMMAVPAALLLLGAAGWYMAGRAMKPVAVIADTAESITAKDLDKRIPMVGNDAELQRLVRVSNSMLDRLEKSYHQAVRFSSDAAHELQTPLTILQGELDLAIQAAPDGSEEQQRCSQLLEETRNLKAIIQKLLLLAHADEGRLPIHAQPVNLSELIENAAEDIEFMAPKLSVFTDIDDSVRISADPALLNQVIRNMTSNAAKYSTAGGTAVFVLTRGPDRIRFTLSNTAPDIPAADQPLLFDRFYRAEKSRTAAGSGLGLSLAREIARAHGGGLVLNPYQDGMVSFTLYLPNA